MTDFDYKKEGVTVLRLGGDGEWKSALKEDDYKKILPDQNDIVSIREKHKKEAHVSRESGSSETKAVIYYHLELKKPAIAPLFPRKTRLNGCTLVLSSTSGKIPHLRLEICSDGGIVGVKKDQEVKTFYEIQPDQHDPDYVYKFPIPEESIEMIRGHILNLGFFREEDRKHFQLEPLGKAMSVPS